jgi:hypothetical protein
VAGCSGAAGAANAVDVGLGLVGDVDIDDKGDVFDIHSTGCDIGCDENGKNSFFEFLEGTLPFRLPWIASASKPCELMDLQSLFAPCLVREKMMVRPFPC